MTNEQKCNLLNLLAVIYSENGYCTYEDLECSCAMADSEIKSTIKLMKKKGIINLVNDDGIVYYELKERVMDNVFVALGCI